MKTIEEYLKQFPDASLAQYKEYCDDYKKKEFETEKQSKENYDGKMIKCLFPFYTTWDWILRSLEDYVAYEQPYQITHWLVIDKNNNLKIYRKFYNTLHEGIYNSVSAMIEDSNIKYIVGPMSKCYDLEYFIKYLTDNNIEFNKELNNEGKWILFM